jgi:hypothetical protein
MVTLTLNNYFDRERHEIEESFEALDAEKTGRLGIEHAYSILLGLGYIADYKKKDEFSPATLEEAAKEIERAESGDHDDSDWISGITLETLLKVVDTVRAMLGVPFFVVDRNQSLTQAWHDDCGCWKFLVSLPVPLTRERTSASCSFKR